MPKVGFPTIILFLVNCGLSNQLEAQTPRNFITVAVMDFSSEGSATALTSFRTTIADNLVNALIGTRGIRVVERTRLSSVLTELELSVSGVIGAETAARIGNALGVDGIILGSYTTFGDQIRINARYVDANSIEIKAAQQVTGTDLFTLIDMLAEQLIIELTPLEEERKQLIDERRLRGELLLGHMKSPSSAAAQSLLLPILGHAYIGTSKNILRGIVYTAVGTGLIAVGISWNLGDDGLLPFLIGLGVHGIAAIDAGFSASKYNEQLLNNGVIISFHPVQTHRSLGAAILVTFR